jgi:hypothetical protein
MTTNDYRICANCQQEKLVDEFYKRHNGSPYKKCKECHKAQSTQIYHQKGHDHVTPINRSETIVIDRLIDNNIPAFCGKMFGFKWADVVAWGCVLIECKLSSIKRRDGLFGWSFSPIQQEQGLRAHLVVLCADYGHEVTYHLFAADNPIFYDSEGKRKSHVAYAPNVRYQHMQKSPLTKEVMKAHRDNWQLVEDYRIYASTHLSIDVFNENWRVK